MHDLLSDISAENDNTQITTLTNTERLCLSIEELQFGFQITTRAIPDTIFVVAVDSQWKDPDPTTAREMTRIMVTISNGSKERVKRWPTAVKNAGHTCITKLWTKSNRVWTHNFSHDTSYACDGCILSARPCLRRIIVKDREVIGWAELPPTKRTNGTLGRWKV